MAQPARAPGSTPEGDPEALPFDPLAVSHAYRRERLRRRAERARRQERKLASVRFAAVLCILLAVSVFLALTAWHEVQRLFGL